MKKTYENPMLQVVSIKNHVISTSGVETGSALGNVFNGSDVSYSAGRRYDDWYEGY